MSDYKARWYGLEGATDRESSMEAPRVQRLKGIALVQQTSDETPVGVAIYWDSASGPQKVMMEYGEAMFLLSALKSAQLDMGTSFPDDPREGSPSIPIQ